MLVVKRKMRASLVIVCVIKTVCAVHVNPVEKHTKSNIEKITRKN